MDDLFDDEKPFRAYLSASRARSAQQTYRATRPSSSSKSSRSSSGRRTSYGAGRPVSPNYTAFNQRAVVKMTVRDLSGQGRAKARAHLDYLQRDGAGTPDQDPTLFTKTPDEQPDTDAFFHRCDDDRHQFRVILSPEHGERLDLEEYTRNVMDQVEDDLDADLDWVAVQHHNTDNPHVHLVIRGRDRSTDEDLYIAPHYMNQGFRQRAEEVATYHLGPRSQTEVRAAQEKQVEQDRLTDLDRSLLAASDEQGRVRLQDLPGRDAAEQHLHRRRLAYLEDAGLVASDNDAWTLPPELRSELRERGRQRDIIARLREADRQPDDRLHSHRPTQRRLARVAHRGLADDHSGDRYIIADGSDGRTYYIDDDPELAAAAPPGAVIALGDDAPDGSDAVLTERRLADVVEHEGPTFLDHPDNLDAVENTTERGAFYHELRAQMDRRHAFLRKHDVSFDDGRPHYPDLRDLEKRAAVTRLAEKHSRQPTDLQPGDTVRGHIVDHVDLEAGDYVAIATDDEQLALLPANRYTEQAADEPGPVEVRVDERDGRRRHFINFDDDGHIAQVLDRDSDRSTLLVRTETGNHDVSVDDELAAQASPGDIVRVGRNAPSGTEALVSRSPQPDGSLSAEPARYQRFLEAQRRAASDGKQPLDLGPGAKLRARVTDELDIDGQPHVALQSSSHVAIVPSTETLRRARRDNQSVEVSVEHDDGHLRYRAQFVTRTQDQGPTR